MMNQEELKQRLVELIASKICNRHVKDICLTKWSDGCGECEHGRNFQIGDVADHLIENGVTIRERGEWIKRTPCSEPECSECGRCPKLVFGMLPDFCPHCGSDMRGNVE